MKVYDGPALIAERTRAPLVLVRIEGAEYTPFSRLAGKVRRQLFPKLRMTVFPPRRLSQPEGLSGRARRAALRRALRDEMVRSAFASARIDSTLFDSLLEARSRHGGGHLIADDMEQRPMNYRTVIAASYALGAVIARRSRPGERVGMLDNLLVDTATGKIEYAVILVARTDHHLHPIPWTAVKITRDANGKERMVVDTNQYKIHPDVSMKDVTDLSPAVETLVKNIETLRADEQKRAKQRPIERSTGPTGEQETGGAGPSGDHSAPPPGPAPSFENEQDKLD